MNSQLQVFENEEFGKVRVLEIDGTPWWVLKDVCAALDLSSPHKVAERLDEDERNQIPLIDGIGRKQKTAIINESGLYAVILRSDKPNAKKFRRWITSEVLPSIRKHGAYVIDEVLEEAAKNQDFAFELFRKLQAEKGKTAALLDKVETLAPKARYYDLILQSKGIVQVSLIAKDYGMSAVTFNRLLHDLGIQYRIGSTWVLYQRHANQGYTKSRTYYTPHGSSVMHTYWTQKGRLFLYDMLGAAGILPLMEIEDAADFAFGEAFQ